MSTNLFALLVGINKYRSSTIKNLNGCVNDIQLLETFLKERYGNFDQHICTLVDEQATRDNIIAGFENHLSQAKTGDYILFHFSGYGSLQKAATEFHHRHQIGWDETLVCNDSRTNGSWDLADKEMAYLLHKLNDTGANIVLITDSCHSGSVFRGPGETVIVNERLAPRAEEERSLASYLDGVYLNASRPIDIPGANYLQLAASQRNESAWECMTSIDNEQRTHGLFTSRLIKTLQSSEKALGYLEAFTRTRSLISRSTYQQTPALNILGEFDPYRLFLSDEASYARNRFTMSYNFDDKKWQLNKGILDGIEAGMNVKILDNTGNDPGIATTVKQARFEKSFLEKVSGLNDEEEYQVKVLDRPKKIETVFV